MLIFSDVDRVVKVLPQAQLTLTCSYFGWIPGFIVNSPSRIVGSANSILYHFNASIVIFVPCPWAGGILGLVGLAP